MKRFLPVVVLFVMCQAFSVASIHQKTEKVIDPFDGVYLGIGIGKNFGRYDSHKHATGVGLTSGSLGVNFEFDQQKLNRDMCGITAGIGKTYGKFYYGLDVLLDFFESKTMSVLVDGQEPIEGSHDSDSGYVKYAGGPVPTIGIRLGYIDKSSGIIFYVKPAVVFDAKTALHSDESRTRKGPENELDGGPREAVFSVALGVEKLVYHNVSVRLEGEKLMSRSFTADSFKAHGGSDTGWRTKGDIRKYNVRLFLVYNFNH